LQSAAADAGEDLPDGGGGKPLIPKMADVRIRALKDLYVDLRRPCQVKAVGIRYQYRYLLPVPVIEKREPVGV
jgi:hypothetical protein